jgi:hypothetical protein
VVRNGQVRSFSRELKNRAAIRQLRIESYANAVAPTFVAITAETGDTAAPQYADASAQAATRNDGSTAKSDEGFKWGQGSKPCSSGAAVRMTSINGSMKPIPKFSAATAWLP